MFSKSVEANNPVMDETSQLGPSYDGTVVLDIGGDIGALIIMTSPELHLAEIEVSPLEPDRMAEHTHDPVPDHGHAHDGGHSHGAHSHGAHSHGARTHVAVRERRGPSGIRYAAIYPALTAGRYTVWGLDGTPHDTVTITGGEVTQIDWA